MFPFPSNGKTHYKQRTLNTTIRAADCFHSLQTGKRMPRASDDDIDFQVQFVFPFPSNGNACQVSVILRRLIYCRNCFHSLQTGKRMPSNQRSGTEPHRQPSFHSLQTGTPIARLPTPFIVLTAIGGFDSLQTGKQSTSEDA